MDYIFIDFENLPVQSIPIHAGIQKLFLLAGEKQKSGMEITDSMMKLGSKAELILMKGAGSNALDFHIAYYLGKNVDKDPKGTFKIVSKDKGFDPLVQHLVSLGIKCSRIETLATKALSKKELRELIGKTGAHLLGLSEKARPKKVVKLKAYIKNHAHEEDAVVDQVLEGLLLDKSIGLDGVKVVYGKGQQNG